MPFRLAHQTAYARVTQKTLEGVLSNTILMKAEVDFMYATKHLEMALANSAAGVTVFTGL